MHYAQWKKPEPPKTTYFMTAFTWHSGKGKTIGTENQSVVARAGKGERSCLHKGEQAFQELMELFSMLIMVVVTQEMCLGLPWWRSGWESACQCRGYGFEPWSGKIPHAAEQLGPWATTTEPARLELVLRNKRGCDSERPAHRDEEWSPLAATRESPRTETKTQHSQN